MLKDTTNSFIERLSQIDLFSSAGIPIADSSILQVYSWLDASKHAHRALHRGSPRMEAKGMLTSELTLKYKERRAEWNILTEAINDHISPFLEQCVKKIDNLAPMLQKSALEDIHLAINYDVGCACMELEYADLVPPRYFIKTFDWYFSGHFPCGWKGHYPKGNLVVY